MTPARPKHTKHDRGALTKDIEAPPPATPLAPSGPVTVPRSAPASVRTTGVDVRELFGCLIGIPFVASFISGIRTTVADSEKRTKTDRQHLSGVHD